MRLTCGVWKSKCNASTRVFLQMDIILPENLIIPFISGTFRTFGTYRLQKFEAGFSKLPTRISSL